MAPLHATQLKQAVSYMWRFSLMVPKPRRRHGSQHRTTGGSDSAQPLAPASMELLLVTSGKLCSVHSRGGGYGDRQNIE
jgi:hypothetical protein